MHKPLMTGLLFDYEVVKVRFFQKLGRWEGHHCVRATPQGVYFAAPIYEVVELLCLDPRPFGVVLLAEGVGSNGGETYLATLKETDGSPSLRKESNSGCAAA